MIFKIYIKFNISEETKVSNVTYYMIDKGRLDLFRVTLKMFKEFNDQCNDIYDNLEEIVKSALLIEQRNI